MSEHQTLQPDGEADITAAHHVLDLEVQELGWEAQLLNHAGILSGSQARLLLAV